MLAWVLAAPAFADWPLGAEIPSAVVLDVTPAGLDAVTGLVAPLVPSEVPIPYYELSDSSCSFLGCTYEYTISLRNGAARLSLDQLTIDPGTGVLNLHGTLTFAVNSAADPMVLDATFDSFGLNIIDETCDAWVDPVTLDLDAAVQLTLLADGTIDAYVPPFQWQWNLVEDDIHLSSCFVADVNDVLDFFGLNLFGFVIDTLEPEVDTIVADLAPEIELALEDAFGSISAVEGSVDLLGTPLDYAISPSELTIVEDGVRVGLTGSFSTTPNPCVAQYGITESLATPGLLPPVGGYPTVLGYEPHVGVAADDDLVNAALFAVWQSGVLCQTIDATAAESIGLPVDTSLLGLIAPGVFDDLFATTSPLTIGVLPTQPPTASAQGGHDINVDLDGLQLDFFAEVDGRPTRLMGVDLAAQAGVDLTFDALTGNLAVGLALGGDDLTAAIAYNELKPDANDQIASSLDGLLDTLVGPLITGLLGDTAFPLPSFSGFGVTALDIVPTGDLDLDPTGGQGEALGLYGTIGPVSYTSTDAGCGTTTGYGYTGTGTSTCATTPVAPTRGLMLAFGLLFALRRRR